MKTYLVMGLGFALAMIAGCGNKDQPQTAVPAPPMAAAEAPPSVVSTPPPARPNAVDDGVQRPMPGQANDHSTPGFDGGTTDKKK